LRFLTWDWWNGNLEDDDYESRPIKFRAHLEDVGTRLPKDLSALFDKFELHDGTLIDFDHNPLVRTLTLLVDGWNNFNGDYQVFYKLNFSGVEEAAFSSPVEIAELETIGYYEADISQEGLFTLDILFWKGIELHLTFEALTLEARLESFSGPIVDF
jgi:hypothetical protein